MPSKPSLLKLFDEAILPAFLVVGTKVISFLLLAIFLDLKLPSFSDLPSILFLTTWVSVDYAKFVQVSSVSSMFTFLVLLIFFGWVIIKAHHFHDSHLSPRDQQKLIRSGWEHLVESSHEIYHQALVWITLTWFFFFYVLVSTYLGLTSWWVPFLGTAVVFSLTMMMVEDVINEFKISKSEARNPK